jgi:glycosyltransferase involved in cell wall biosynthesis
MSSHIRIVGYQTNKGKGYAIRFGMAQSKGDIIGFIDAGGDIDSDGIEMLLLHMRWYNADIIIGSKRHPVSKIEYPFIRKILSIGYQMIIRIFFGLSIRDSQVGIKLYKRYVLEDVLPRLLVKQFAFDIEVLSVAHHLGYRRIYEAPVTLDFSGASSITSSNFWKVIWRTLWDTAAVFYRLKILRYYDNTSKRKWKYDPELNFRVNIG